MSLSVSTQPGKGVNPLDFMNFLYHTELVSKRLKTMLANMGEHVEKWKLPMREEDYFTRACFTTYVQL